MEVKGKLVFIGNTVQRTESFRTREFVIMNTETVGDKSYDNYIKFQAVQAKTELLNGYGLNDAITVHFNIKGSKWIKEGVTNYMTNLDAWKIEGVESGKAYQQAPAQQSDISYEQVDDLPF